MVPPDVDGRSVADAVQGTQNTQGEGDEVFHPTITLRNITVGSRMIAEAFEDALGLVREGQQAEVLVHPCRTEDDVTRYPWGEFLKQTTVWDMEVLELRRPHLLPPGERVEAAEARKSWGNDLYHREFYGEALDKYKLAETCLKNSKDIEKSFPEVRLPLMLKALSDSCFDHLI
ncbi:hypothetical protein T484DRAFT_1778272 [Baffinella frigidus]|nr:hypothetical protein T484DRAFT_1778272 [Cryptophyta sp. CCMP2293]